MKKPIAAFALSLLLLAHSGDAAQEVKVKTALDYSLREYGFFMSVALLGGVVRWAAKLRAGELQAWSVHHLIGELATSALAGLLCFWVCEWAGAAPLLTAAMVGVSGHMGTRALSMLEEWASRRFVEKGDRA